MIDDPQKKTGPGIMYPYLNYQLWFVVILSSFGLFSIDKISITSFTTINGIKLRFIYFLVCNLSTLSIDWHWTNKNKKKSIFSIYCVNWDQKLSFFFRKVIFFFFYFLFILLLFVCKEYNRIEENKIIIFCNDAMSACHVPTEQLPISSANERSVIILY